jgi:hypothetical protein
LDGLLAPGGGSISADIMMQAQKLDLVILDRSVHGRHIIALVELTCPWDTDAKRAEERKASRYADLKTAFSNDRRGHLGGQNNFFPLIALKTP